MKTLKYCRSDVFCAEQIFDLNGNFLPSEAQEVKLWSKVKYGGWGEHEDYFCASESLVQLHPPRDIMNG